jgi:hypothetical protein
MSSLHFREAANSTPSSGISLNHDAPERPDETAGGSTGRAQETPIASDRDVTSLNTRA